MLVIDSSVMGALKIFGHFFITALLVLIFRKMRIHPFFAVLLAFSLISFKEVLDMAVINFVEFDDVALNFAGALFGSIV